MIVRTRFIGVAEAISALLAFAVMSVVIVYIVYYLYSFTPPQKSVGLPSGYMSEKLVLFLVEDVGTKVLNVKNVGSVTVEIEYVVLVDSLNLKRSIVTTSKENICTISSGTVAPGEVVSVSCSETYVPIAVITKNGRVFSIDPRLYAILIERYVGIPMTTIYGGIMLTSTADLLVYLEEKGFMYGGAMNTSLSLNYNFTASDVRLTGQLDASMVIVGKNPVSNRLNIFIIGYGTRGSYISVRDSAGAVTTVSLDSIAPYRFRLKIEDFHGDMNFDLGIHPCYINTSGMCRLLLNGTANKVLIYGSSSNSTGITGFDPYLFVGDINNNGNVEVVFITQDYEVGNSTTINDRVILSGRPVNSLDSNIEPLRIVFTNVPVDSRVYSSAILSIRMFFWDNSLNDITDNDNRVLMKVGLYDNSTKKFVYSTQLSYYELNRYRNVKPFTISYITKDFIINIPKTGNTYYVAVEIVDPFYIEDNRNDADIAIGLEYVGIALSTR